MNRLHTAGLCAALTTLGGVFISPPFLNLVPAKYAGLVTVLGLLLQAFTKPVTAGGTDLVPKINPLELPPPESRV